MPPSRKIENILTMLSSESSEVADEALRILISEGTGLAATWQFDYVYYEEEKGRIGSSLVPETSSQRSEYMRHVLALLNANADDPRAEALISEITYLAILDTDALHSLGVDARCLENLMALLLDASIIPGLMPLVHVFQNVQMLLVTGTPSDTTTEMLFAFRKVRHFSYIGASVTQLVSWNPAMPALDSIDLSATAIKDIPGTFSATIQAKSINLEGLLLERIPLELLEREDIAVSRFGLIWSPGMQYVDGLEAHLDRLITESAGWNEIPAWFSKAAGLSNFDKSGNAIPSLAGETADPANPEEEMLVPEKQAIMHSVKERTLAVQNVKTELECLPPSPEPFVIKALPVDTQIEESSYFDKIITLLNSARSSDYKMAKELMRALGTGPEAIPFLEFLGYNERRQEFFERQPFRLATKRFWNIAPFLLRIIYDNRDSEVPELRRFIEGVRHLRLVDSNQQAFLCKGLCGLSNLESVVLSGTFIPAFSGLARRFPKLKSCEIVGSVVLPEKKQNARSFKWKGLESLEFEAAHAHFIHKNRRVFSSVERIVISGNVPAGFVRVLSHFPALRILKLTSWNTTKVPPNLDKLTNLEVLDIGGSGIFDLPPRLESLLKTSKARIEGLVFLRIPREILARSDIELPGFRLVWHPSMRYMEGLEEHLEHLEARGAGWNRIPEWVLRAQRLQSLDVSKNPLTELPTQLFELPCLEEIVASECEIGRIEISTSQGRASALKALDVYSNRLTSLPEEIRMLKALESIDARRNRLEFIPETIGELDRLKELKLRFNKLRHLPPSLAACRNLLTIDLNENTLRSLPRGLARLGRIGAIKQRDQDEREILD